MLVTYFDEVKYQKSRQPYYWLAGIVVSGPVLVQLEEQVNELSESVFGSRELLEGTEFHASDILSGNKHFEDCELSKRIEILKRLISIFGSIPADQIGKIYCKIDVERMLKSDHVDEAFMFFVERVDGYLRARQEPGLLIGDKESETISRAFAHQLSSWRSNGTYYEYGVKLTCLIDTVHFTHSHQSRMLQLADLHVWLRQLCSLGDQGKWHRKQIIDHIRSIPDCLYVHKYKEWPTEGSRLQKG